jgi:serine/threonine protein kinase
LVRCIWNRSANLIVDLNSGNVIWGLISLDNFSLSDKYKHFGQPIKLRTPPGTWKDGEIVKPIDIPNTFLTDRFYLADFGHSIKTGTSVNPKWISPFPYCAPELFHNVDPSTASDMWSYMCLFSELYGTVSPFHGYLRGPLLTRHNSRLGPLPQEWAVHYNGPDPKDDSWYNPNPTPPRKTLKGLIEFGKPEISTVEHDLVFSIMSRGFCYSPERRPTALQLLHDPAFQTLMQMYGC